jgi:Ca-activated chloride channel homolog
VAKFSRNLRSIAVKKPGLFFGLAFIVLFSSQTWAAPEEGASHIQVNVDMVQLNVAVTDSKGNYITGLQPKDFMITEDRIPQKIAVSGEGNSLTRTLIDPPGTNISSHPVSSTPDLQLPQSDRPSASSPDSPDGLSALISGANVFILFDTSNYMYRGFVFAQDAITDFVRSLDAANKIAFYSYSHELSRAAQLTSDRSQVLRGVRTTVAGDDAALYNSLLLTVKDAARYTGRKVVVVFSNGPDNASMVPPEDVAELAQSAGIVIYMISTRLAQLEPVSTAVFERMTKATGGKVYFAKNWKEEREAFASIRDDLSHLYSLSYYPQPNPNRGWRTISVKLIGPKLQKYRIRTRDGYRIQTSQLSSSQAAAPLAEGSVSK